MIGQQELDYKRKLALFRYQNFVLVSRFCIHMQISVYRNSFCLNLFEIYCTIHHSKHDKFKLTVTVNFQMKTDAKSCKKNKSNQIICSLGQPVRNRVNINTHARTHSHTYACTHTHTHTHTHTPPESNKMIWCHAYRAYHEEIAKSNHSVVMQSILVKPLTSSHKDMRQQTFCWKAICLKALLYWMLTLWSY